MSAASVFPEPVSASSIVVCPGSGNGMLSNASCAGLGLVRSGKSILNSATSPLAACRARVGSSHRRLIRSAACLRAQGMRASPEGIVLSGHKNTVGSDPSQSASVITPASACRKRGLSGSVSSGSSANASENMFVMICASSPRATSGSYPSRCCQRLGSGRVDRLAGRLPWWASTAFQISTSASQSTFQRRQSEAARDLRTRLRSK